MSFEDFAKLISENKKFDNNELEIIKKAFDFAKEKFNGIYRKNGEPYFNHCIRTALNLAKLKMDYETICAGLLHDIIEDAKVEKEELVKEFGENIAFLVEAVTKIGEIKYREKNLVQAENLRKLILYVAEDLRVAILKLADRLDNMRTLEYLPEEKRKRIALETYDVYAPLALRLGIFEWASELDDLSFKFLEPEKYREIEKEIKKRLEGIEEILPEIIEKIEKEIIKRNINLHAIQYRIKKPSSVYRKLQKKNFDFDQIYDLIAFRIIVSTVDECYLVLGILHSLFKPLLEEFDDYITYPKPNGYQSLHTTLLIAENKYAEFQIRTLEMHIKNEEGVAAYFAYAKFKDTKGYKKGLGAEGLSEDEIRFIQELTKWKNINNANAEEFLKELKTDVLQEKIYVFTPKGDVIELPRGSTVLDFAYKIHSEIGHHFAGAKVNNKIVPIDYEPKTGDVIEIITNKNRHPSPDWLKIVKTYNARKHIKSYLKKFRFSEIRQTYELKIIAKDRIGLLKDISNIISAYGINIIEVRSQTKGNLAILKFKLVVNDKDEYERLKSAINRKISDVIKIE
jgi:GTP diphosphokinase / guanosine-3',5'-bis(diphosphate) 3'-diphosphatase